MKSRVRHLIMHSLSIFFPWVSRWNVEQDYFFSIDTLLPYMFSSGSLLKRDDQVTVLSPG
jgi:hypothetical protein